MKKIEGFLLLFRKFKCKNSVECDVETPVRRCPTNLRYDTCDHEMVALQRAAQFMCRPRKNFILLIIPINKWTRNL